MLRKTLNWISIYMPVFLLGALALGSYFLTRYTPPSEPPASAATPKHEPDYFMRNFAVRSFEANGQLKSEVFGTELRHYPDTDTSEIDAPRIRKVSNLGRTTEGTAGRAVANGDGSEVQLIGNVVIIRGASPMNPENLGTANAATARLEFRGEFIHALIDFETLKSHRPAVLTRGLDRFAADSFIYDQVQGVVELKGRVNGQLTPKDSR